MKLIKKYKFGNTVENPYFEYEPEPLVTEPSLVNPFESEWEDAKYLNKRRSSIKDFRPGTNTKQIKYYGGTNAGYAIDPQVVSNTGSNWRDTIRPELEKFLNIDYNFGGKRGSYNEGLTVDHNPPGLKHKERLYAGIDCSGFVLWFAKDYLGIDIGGSAKEEYDKLKKLSGHEVIVKKNGKPVAFNVNDVLPGDVIYFGNKDHSKRHIGIIHSIKNGKIYYTNAAGNDIAKVCTIPIDDYVDSHANVYITSLRKDRNYNLNLWQPGNFSNWDFNNVTANTQNGLNGWYYNTLNFNNTGESVKSSLGVVNTNSNNNNNYVNYWDIRNANSNPKKQKNKKSKKPKYNS